MLRNHLFLARWHVAALGAALAVSVPTGAVAENWVAITEGALGTLCVDRDSIRWEGLVAIFNTSWCVSSHPGVGEDASESSVDCAQDLSGDFVYVAHNGQWDHVYSTAPAGVAARAVCQGL